MSTTTITTADLAPDRILNLVRYATELGMVVEFETDTREGRYRDAYMWVIKSGKPNDHDQVWVYWSGPGANGGRTSITRYCPFARRQPSRTTKMTFRQARSWLGILAR
jgi:hypothetical protein